MMPQPQDISTLTDTVAFPSSAFIDGKWHVSSSVERLVPIHPATGNSLPEIVACDERDVDQAVAAARRSFDDGRWRGLSPLTRQAILFRLADLIDQHRDELALFDTLEMGKPLADARSDASVAAGFFRFFAGAVDKFEGAVMTSDSRTHAFTRLEPRGVVGAITPWNFPVINAALKIAPAIAAGNSMVLKPSEIASYSTLKLAALAVEAGVPAGVLNAVPGLGNPVGSTLGKHHDVDMVSFTGSTATGRRLMAMSAESNAKPLLLECGGKSPVIVFADMADRIETVAAAIVGGAFWNSGQVCVARSRLLVEESVHAKLVEAISALVDRMELVDPLTDAKGLGPLASAAQHSRVSGFITNARTSGARQVTRQDEEHSAGSYVRPVVFDQVTPEMTIAREEIFGPVLSVLKFKTTDEAIRIANDTPYGLAATVWSRDLSVAMKSIRDISAGKVVVLSDAPSGEGAGFSLGSEPWNQSGFGVESGMAGIRSYSRTKSVEIVS